MTWGNKNAKLILLIDRPASRAYTDSSIISGRGGQNLQLILDHAGISSNDAYVLCANPSDIPEKALMNAKGVLTLRGTDLATKLRAQLHGLDPYCVVPMGRVSCSFLLQDARLDKLRGSCFQYNGYKVIPTRNPFTSGFNTPDRYIISADLTKAKRMTVKEPYKPPDMNIMIDPAPNIVERYLADAEVVSCDIEVSRGQVFCIGFSKDEDTAMVVNLDRPPPERGIMWRICAEFLDDPTKTVVGQNFIYDMNMLWRLNHIRVSAKIHDTMIAHHIMYPDFEKSLQFLTSMYTTIPYYKDEGGFWKSGVGDRKSFLYYNGKDCIATFRVWEKLKDKILGEKFVSQYEETIAMYEPLIYLMYRGLNVDMRELTIVKHKLREEITSIDASLQGVVQKESNHECMELNYNSPKQCMEYFYGTLGLPPYRKGGKPTVDDKALAQLAKTTSAREGLYSAQLIQQLRQRKKLFSTYLDIDFDKDHRFRSEYKPRGTRTGRLSSSKTFWGSGMNAQNVPPEMKAFLVADKDKLLIEMDKRQSEWVITAYLANAPEMIRVITTGVDPHAATAEMVTGIPLEAIRAENKAIGHTTNPEEIDRIRSELIVEELSAPFKLLTSGCFLPRTLSVRQMGKKCNHALNYMMGARQFSLETGMAEAECSEARNKYLTGYGRLPEWWEEVRKTVQKDRGLRNICHQYRAFIGTCDDAMLKDAVAHLPQSVSAWMVNMAMVDVYHSPHAECVAGEMLANVHDSILFQYPTDKLDELARFCSVAKYAMEPELTSPAGVSFRVETDIKIGLSWGHMVETTFQDVGDTAWKLVQAKR